MIKSISYWGKLYFIKLHEGDTSMSMELRQRGNVENILGKGNSLRGDVNAQYVLESHQELGLSLENSRKAG